MKDILLFVIKFYKKHISPLFVSIFGHACRFEPTCSEYSYQAVEKYGVLKGVALAILRVAKCNPLFTPGFDPL